MTTHEQHNTNERSEQGTQGTQGTQGIHDVLRDKGPRQNIREWAVLDNMKYDHTGKAIACDVVHRASCRRCGDSIESVNDKAPVVLFRDEHRVCPKEKDVKY